MQTTYDVLVIGAGITGGCVLHELSKYQLNIAVIDKETTRRKEQQSEQRHCPRGV